MDVTVYYCLRRGVDEALDPEFRKKYKWDIPLLDGYRSIFLKNLSFGSSPTFWGQINPGIFSELRREKYDALVVHGYNAFTNWMAFLGCLVTKTPIILRGEAELREKTNFLKRLAKKIILTPLFGIIDAFLYSYTRNRDFFKYYGASEEKLFFHPCSVDNRFLEEEAKILGSHKLELRQEIGVKRPELPAVLYTGKFIKRKRVRDLLEACQIIKGSNKHLTFNVLLVGDGPERENLEAFARKNNLENVYFFGFKNQSEMPLFYATSDIFVLPSSLDPSPKSINEAMNFALPVITTKDVGTAPDLVLEGKTGLIYKTGDVIALSASLAKLLNDSEFRENLGRGAQNLVRDWSFEGMVKGLRGALRTT